MGTDLSIFIGREAAQKLVLYCQENQIDRMVMAADTNTYRAMGERLAGTLGSH
jgi:hypothetical protein